MQLIKTICLVLIGVLILPTLSQSLEAQAKKPLDHTVYDQWKRLRYTQLSDDGKWASYVLDPQEGDPTLMLHNLAQKEYIPRDFARSTQALITKDNRFLLFKIKPNLDSVKAMRRRKVKKKDLPSDSLGIYSLAKDTLIKIPYVKSYKTPEKAGGWVAYQLEILTPKILKEIAQADSIRKAQNAPQEEIKEEEKEPEEEIKEEIKEEEKENTEPPTPLEVAQNKIKELEEKLQKIAEEKEKEKEEKERKKAERERKKKEKKEDKDSGTRLILRELNTARQDTFLFVTEYLFDEKGTKLAFASTGDDSTFKAGVYVYNLKDRKLTQILNEAGKHKRLTWDEAGEQLAFVADTDTTKANEKAQTRYYHLYYWQERQKVAKKVATESSNFLPKEWFISEHARLRFAKDGSKLYFGTAPKPLEKDTTLLPEEIVKVDVWHWQDERLQSQQNVELKDDLRRSYTAVMYTNNQRCVQLGKPEIANVITGNEGNADFAIGLDSRPYERNASWEGYPLHYDVYVISYRDGSARKIKTKLRATRLNLSPNAQYIYWYNAADSLWQTYAIRSGQTHNLSDKVKDVVFYDELHDMPQVPYPYGTLGWTKDDKQLLIYDRYDIWQFDPENRTAPSRLTKGREDRIRYRYVRLDEEERFLTPGNLVFLHAFDEEQKFEGYFTTNLNNPNDFRKLIFDDYKFSYPEKAKNANRYLFTRQNFQEYPDLYHSDLNFTKIERLSNANPQQANYYWGSVEQIRWTAPNGDELTGLLYKPENFDPNKKYPMITYFYERVSDRLHNYVAPTPSPSTVRASMYTSNGYIIFMPDIPYRIGYPGQSAYEAIMSGVTAVLNLGFVDKDKLGIQGQSWGGYQVAYLVTRTNLFAAAMAGAPVSNMTSAYGGIRWGSGLSRMFQYEHSQSRIGATLWERPLLYLENSPLFSADKVETPLLMMHNDGDGAVPWYQGIEYFVALRRLNKPVWMLNYNGEEHNLMQRKNRKDLSRRMMQFFDYYLRFKPAPRWLKEGVPAKEKGIKQGYEYLKN